VARKAALFGTGGRPPGLYGIGPYRDLLGRSLTGFAVRRSAALRGSIDNSELFDAVDPRSGYLPVHLTGELEGSGANRPLDLAGAVNGRIAATTRSRPGEGPMRFDAMLPESALERGPNAVEVFAVLRGGRGLVLLAEAGPQERR
jgi:hypothetical protein